MLGTGTGKGSGRTHNLAAALDRAVPDGSYYWRVRGLDGEGNAGRWSQTRRVVKAWTSAPQITGGDGASVNRPSIPLILRWTSVPYATRYIVSIATDPALSNIVLGSATSPQETQGTDFALPSSLAPGAYFWAVTPEDAQGHRGVRSRVAGFQRSWPTPRPRASPTSTPTPACSIRDPRGTRSRAPRATRSR